MAYSFGGKRALMSIMLLLQTTLDFVICAENQSSESLPKDLQNYSREHRGAKHREAIAEACEQFTAQGVSLEGIVTGLSR